MEGEIWAVIRQGVIASFPGLTGLRGLRYYQMCASADTPALGVPVLKAMLKLAANDFDPGPRSKAIADLLAVDAHGRTQRRLNREGGLRDKAGAHFKIGWDQFGRTIEPQLVGDFAEFLTVWDSSQHLLPTERLQLRWDDIERAADQMWRALEREFRPDIVVTMSGPGSFAAIYTMRLSPRDVPVVMAVTFPRREHPDNEELQFRQVATGQRWIGLSTSKWSVWIPPVFALYPKGSRVLVLDDRVITGETQALLRGVLTAQGLDVRCAALFGPRDCQVENIIIARRIEGEFDMPWGPSRGRT